MTAPNDSALLAGKVVLVTGASRGIGAAIAFAAGKGGANVVVMARSGATAAVSRLKESSIPCVAFEGDVSNPEDATRAVETAVGAFGSLDVLVNNAAVLALGPLLEAPVEDFDRLMSVNVRGPFLMSQAAGRHMSARGQGVIINIGSDLALRGRADYAIYCTSKGALLQLTRASAIELGAYGVRVVMLSPAATNAGMAAPALADPEIRADLISKGTIGRINEPEDVAAAAIFLASPLARTVTGCNWPVDAGVLAR
jgi:NAD(P)-dependent dehydrogenase (short-subunit alcohol dehydrogenase family)